MRVFISHIVPGLFEYEEYISLKSINDPNEGYVAPHPSSCSALLTFVDTKRSQTS